MGGAMAPSSRFLPPLALMGVIFFLSAQPDLGTGLGGWDTILRKAAHMTEFGLLWWLWRRALRSGVAAAAITIAYAASDELHQHFVAGRHGATLDVAIDAAGIALAVVLSRFLPARRRRRRRPAGAPGRSRPRSPRRPPAA
jgi:VanZ family protein